MSEDLRRSTLESGVWLLGDFTFASLKRANNKLDMPRALRRAISRRPLIDRMAELADEYKPEAVWGVPHAGQEYAQEVSDALEVPLIGLRMTGLDDQGKKKFGFWSNEDRKLARRCGRIVGIEDLTTEFTSFNATLRLPELADSTLAIVAGCRRGTPDVETRPNLPMAWAFEFQVPNVITKEHPLFVQYGHLAIGEFVTM